MRLQQIHLDTPVACSDGACGRVSAIIVNPVARAVTSVVVRENNKPRREVIVPARLLGKPSCGMIQVDLSTGGLERCERFSREHFIRLEPGDERLAGYLMLPYVLPGSLLVPVSQTRVPHGQLAVRRGARVLAADGPDGEVEEFLVDPADCRITHLVVREGLIFRRAVCIPVDAIEGIDLREIHLRISREQVRRLPHIPIWRRYLAEGSWSDELEKIAARAGTLRQAEIARLTEGLRSRSYRTRLSSRRELAAIGRPAIPAVEALLHEKKHRIVWEAVKTLAEMRDPASIPGLLEAMGDPRFDIRWIAAQAMVELDGPALKALLERLVQPSDAAPLRESAHHVIRSLAGPNPGGELRDVLLRLEDFTSLASLPRAAETALRFINNHPEAAVPRPAGEDEKNAA